MAEYMYKKFIRYGAICAAVMLVILFFVNLIVEGSTDGMHLIMAFRYDSFINIHAWSQGIASTIEVLSIGRGLYTMHGSQLPQDAQGGVLTISCLALSFLWCVLASMISNSSLGIIMKKAFMEESQKSFDDIFRFNMLPLELILVPQGLGLIGAAQLWSIMYFAVLSVGILNNQIINILVIEKSITEAYPRMIRYRNYMLAIICILLGAITISFSSEEIFNVASCVFVRDVLVYEIFNTFIFALLICYIYGIQRLSDDIHFFMGSQPTKFWKICWGLVPVLIFIPIFIHIANIRAVGSYMTNVLHLFILMFLFSPVTVAIFIQVYKHLKQHNLIGLFQSQERWGPSDPQERHLRRLFNPRQEIRSRRRNDTCPHKCLIGSKVLKKLTEDEAQNRKDAEDNSTANVRKVFAHHQDFSEENNEPDIMDLDFDNQ